jgi:hypothetical protein
MKLYATIAIHVRGEEVMRDLRFLDRVKRAFGSKPDLRSGRVRASIEATAIVEAVREAMQRIGADNAVSLVIDGTVLFNDPHARPDDLGDLFLAFHDNAAVFGAGFEELRLAFEHREGDLHVVAEVQARSEHVREEAAVRVVVSGRIDALTPRPGEDADAFRKRAEPIAADRNALELYRLQFNAFVERLRDALAAALPAARVEIEVAEPRIVRPGPQPQQPPAPESRQYDPYEAYYPSPLGMVANMFMWSALFSMAMPPHVAVVDAANHVQGFADDPGIVNGPTIADDTAGPLSWWGDEQTTSGGADSSAGADDGGSWWDNVFGDGGGGDGRGGGDGDGGGGGGFGDSNFGGGDFGTD